MENRNPGHNKFYEMYKSGTTVHVRFGKLDTVGTVITKKFSTVDEAENFIDKTRWEKDAKGYTMVDGHASIAQLKFYQDKVDRLQKSADYFSASYYSAVDKLNKARTVLNG